MMNTRWKPSIRLLALVLVLSFFICQIPVGAISTPAVEPTGDATNISPSVEVAIVAEDTSKREENVKHFRMSDGTYRAVQYNIPVHFMQDNMWVDYDNTLIETESEEPGNLDLVNTASDYEVRLSKKTNGKKWVRLEKDGYKISWYYVDAEKSTGTTTETEDDGDPTTLENAVSTVTYADIYDNVDLRYRVSPTGIKEDLILKKKGTQTTFVAEYNIDKLTAVQVDAQTIELRDEVGEVVYTLSAPYMTDATGTVSEAMTYKIIDTQNKHITVELTADNDWLADETREFPVMVDPSIETNQVYGQLYRVVGKTLASSTDAQIPTGNFVVGRTDDGIRFRTLIWLNSLMPLDDNAAIVGANLTLYQRMTDGGVKTRAIRLTSNWYFASVAWNNMPTYDENQTLDVSTMSEVPIYPTSGTSYSSSWDITEAVRYWYQYPEKNYGVIIEDTDTTGVIAFSYSDAYADDSALRPIMEIDYRNASGLEDYWKYVGAEAGRGGSAGTNVFNGNLVVSQPVTISAGGNIMPVSINLTYNSNALNEDTTTSHIGRGWQMNYQLTVSKKDMDSDGVFDYYYYTDSDGTIHAFPIVSGETEYNDEDGLGYTLTESDGGYIITDRDDNSIVFNSDGFATAIRNALGKQIQMRYTVVNGAYRLDKVIDGANRSYVFAYDSNAPLRVKSITDPANRTTEFSYDSIERLVEIAYPDKDEMNNPKKVTMTYYNGDGTVNAAESKYFRLTSITGNDGGTLEISYCSNELYRTQGMTKKYGSVVESQVSFEYGLNQTKVIDETDNDRRSLFYQFDYYGQTTGIISNAEGLGLFYEYEDRNDSPLKANKVSQASSVQKTVVNQLPNSGFDTGYAPFYTLQNGTSTKSITRSAEKGRTANGSLMVSRTGTVTSGVADYAYWGYSVTVPQDGYYTFSGYANTNGSNLGGNGAKIRLERWTSNGNQGGKEVYIVKTAENEWKHDAVTMYYNAGDTIKCLVGINETVAKGTAWFDDLQLEYGAVANTRNLLQNTDFSNTSTGWVLPTGASVVTAPPSLSSLAGHAVEIIGHAWENRCVTQTVNVTNGKAGDSYSVGTWAAAFAIPTIKNNSSDQIPAFGMHVEFYSGTTRVGSAQRISCATHMPYAQMIASELVAPADYTAIKISLEYSRNANIAYFTLPYLYRENYGVKYSYDENGQRISSVSQDDSESAYTYDTNYQLRKLVNASQSSAKYYYTEHNQLSVAFSSDGLRTDYKYDSYGNNTQTILSANESSPLIDQGYYYLVNYETGESPNVTYHITAPPVPFDIMDGQQKWRFDEQGENIYRLYSVDSEEQNDPCTLNAYASGMSYYGLLNLLGVSGENDSLFKFVRQDDGTCVILTGESNYTKCVIIGEHEIEGRALMTTTYDAENVTDGQKWEIIANDPTQVAYIKTLTSYTSNGNFVNYTADALDNKTYYTYNQSSGLLQSVTDAEGDTATYTYNVQNGSVSTVTVDGKTISYTYDTADRLATLTAPNGVKYRFVYDAFGRNTAIQIVGTTEANTVTLCQWTYDTDGLLTSQTYANGATYTYTYDDLDRPIGVYCNGAQQQAYFYNAAGDIAAVADIPNRKLIRTVLDSAGRVAEENTYTYTGTATDAQTIIDGLLTSTSVKYQAVYGYDDVTGYLFEETNVTPIGTTAYDYTYGDFTAGEMPDTVYAVESTPSLTGKAEKVTYEYDTLGRVATRTVYLDVANNVKKTTTYTYKAGGYGANSTTTQLDTITTDGVTYQYTYDDVGRITKITQNGTEVESYVYDSLGQLTQVKKNGTVVAAYTYDDGGNITSSTVNGVTNTYTYGNAAWKDQLTAYDGNAITYDAQGNPTAYYDGAAMTWQNGRNLTAYTKGGTTVSFGYASDGTRTSKTANGVTTTYYYVGGRLYGEMTGSNKLVYLYDDTGMPYGYVYNNATYYYERNAQGDVIGIWNTSGVKIANYTYDVWGNVLTITDQNGNDVSNNATHQGNLNPIRYRGYYYDAELNMYWLTTRFYDPEIGRFINADTQLNEGTLGNNVYAYCENDPINFGDTSGRVLHIVVGAAVGGITALVGTLITTAITGKAPSVVDILISTAVGMGAGALTAAFPAAAIAINAVASVAETTINGVREKDSFEEIVTDSLISAGVSITLGMAGDLYNGQTTKSIVESTLYDEGIDIMSGAFEGTIHRYTSQGIEAAGEWSERTFWGSIAYDLSLAEETLEEHERQKQFNLEIRGLAS